MREKDRSDKRFLKGFSPGPLLPLAILVRVAEALTAASRAGARTFCSSSLDASAPAHILKSPQLHLTSPHPTRVPYIRSSTLRLAKALARLGIQLIFRVIQKITGPLPSPVASGRSISPPHLPCGVAAPILRIRANDGIVSPALPPQRSNLSSCSDRSSQERQDGGNNICSKEVNSSR